MIRLIAKLFTVVFTYSLLSAPGQVSAQIEGPGLLPRCPAGTWLIDPLPTAVLTNSSEGWYTFSSRSVAMLVPSAALGRVGSCAIQNWSGPAGGDRAYPQSVDAYAFPNVIDVNNGDTRVTFHIEPAAMSGPISTYMPECFPDAGAETGGCSTGANMIAFREANGAGEFDGRWTIVTAGNNPGFQFTKELDCPSPSTTINSSGVPCSYFLTFAKSPGGVTGITKPMQVVMFNSASNGVDRGTDLVIPMLFTVGGSVDPNPDGTNSPTPTLQPSPESEPNVTATLNVYLSDLLSIISQLKKQFGKSDKQEQLDLRASLRTLANEFLDFVSTNDSEVHTTSANFDLLKASRNAKSKVVRLSGKKKNGFQRKKLQAKKAILGIQKKLSI